MLTKAEEAANANKEAGSKDKVAVEVLASYDNDGTLNAETLKNNFGARGWSPVTGGSNKDDFPVTVTVDGYKFTIDKNGNLTNGEKTPTPEGPVGIEAADLAGQLKTEIGKPVTGLTGGACEDYSWKLFYADSDNIYLIASDYINAKDAPNGKNNTPITDHGNGYKLSMDNVYKDYPNGVESIDTGNTNLNNELQNLNSEFNNSTSNANINMQAVAYMLDSSIWKKKFVGENNNNVKYVIGGPTIKQLFTSYNAKYGTSYEPNISGSYNSDTWSSTNGYKIKKQSGDSWIDSSSGMINSGDDTYVINSTTNADCMRVASPSAYSDYLFAVGCAGDLFSNGYYYGNAGFRPLVCLSSDVHLKSTSIGYEIVN